MKTGTTAPIYNGKSIRFILAHQPQGMTKTDRNWYIKNCQEVYFNELHNIDKGYNECLRNTNFWMIKKYLILNSAR